MIYNIDLNTHLSPTVYKCYIEPFISYNNNLMNLSKVL